MKKSNYYNNIAQIYDQTRWLTESAAEVVTDFIVELTCATPKTSFLEPGVGTGLNIIPLVRRGYSVTGIDISQEMLEQIRQKLNVTPDNLKLIHADASWLPFPDNSFDVILTVHMIHTVFDWGEFLDEIDRVVSRWARKFITMSLRTERSEVKQSQGFERFTFRYIVRFIYAYLLKT